MIELSKLINFQTVNQKNVQNIDPVCTGISINSSSVKVGHVFIAVKGYSADGHDFIGEAIESGAYAIVGEKTLHNLPIPYIQVENSRKALAYMADAFFGYPSRKHKWIGVTGTNGKTTTTFMIKHLLERNGYRCAMFGSIGNFVGNKEYPSINTTPDPLELYRLLEHSDVDYVIMEVSSHGICQSRIEGLLFDYCVFTNLDHEHLDYHGTMEAYFDVKSRLFAQLKRGGKAIIHTDHFWGQKLAAELKQVQVLSFGENQEAYLRYHLKDQNYFTFNKERIPFQLQVPGIHNVYNAGLASLTSLAIGIPSRKISEDLLGFTGVPGRFETIHLVSGQTIVIDYAHTKEAIEHCLQTAREFGAKRVIHIFGFRGDRDSSKRTEMIRVSSVLSDQYYLTLDDLNSVSVTEMKNEPKKIQKLVGNEKGRIVLDRTKAIKLAMKNASAGDWILITGKGNEPYQQRFYLPAKNDREAVMTFIEQKRSIQ